MLNNIVALLDAGAAAGGATSFESIATVTVGAGGASSIEFTSIANTWTHLQIRCFVQENYNASDSNGMIIRFNSDSGSNYSWHKLQGDGSTASASAGATKTFAYCGEIPRYASGVFGAAIIDILDYKDTNKYKTVRSLAGFNSNSTTASTQNMLFVSGSWRNTNAITDITLASDDNTLDFKQYSHVALYGIKGA